MIAYTIIKSFNWNGKYNMRSKFLTSSHTYLIIFLLVLSLLLFLSTQCALFNKRAAIDPKIKFSSEDNISANTSDEKELFEKKTIKILTQNTMLIPFDFVAPAFVQRTNCITDLILKDYGIVCLQEVFNGDSQNKIISAWHDAVYQDAGDENLSKWQSDYFNNWYNSLPGKDKDLWHPLNEARSVAVLAENNNFWGVKVTDRRVNNIQAELICSPYYVMGPDRGYINIRQDSGLIIISKYPIIECSAMTYSSSSGSDRLANKGVIYARIQTGPLEGDYIHVFNTHIQSHDYSEARLAQILELMDFISEIIKSDKNYIRPILIAGDFNVTAEKPDNWMELADINPPKAEELNSNQYLDKEILEYKEFNEILEDFPDDQVTIADIWLELNPEDPGFTWIGKDWITGDMNSYGDIGNQVATEDGGPQRIDYIFYFKGTGNLYLEPVSISLVPGKPGLLYCFDKSSIDPDSQSQYGCKEISLEYDCSHKSYTVSDHLGLELNFVVGKDN